METDDRGRGGEHCVQLRLIEAGGGPHGLAFTDDLGGVIKSATERAHAARVGNGTGEAFLQRLKKRQRSR